MKNPVVLIATHQRIAITTENVSSVLKQQAQVVLVVSDKEEGRYYREKFPSIIVTRHDNMTLGAKWQHGVMEAALLEPNPLIITGSDDILGRDFVRSACSVIGHYDFVGLTQWYTFFRDGLYKYDYTTSVPLGAGRIYSEKLLQAVKLQLFNVSIKKHLDDFGFYQASQTRLPMLLCDDIDNFGLQIVSVKGNWKMLNPFEKIRDHKNCKLLSQSRIKKDVEDILDFYPKSK
jgi:hypothetical protein